jgi:hypothetical protein
VVQRDDAAEPAPRRWESAETEEPAMICLTWMSSSLERPPPGCGTARLLYHFLNSPRST